MEGVDYLADERNKAEFDVDEMKIVWAGSRHSFDVSDRISKLVANDPDGQFKNHQKAPFLGLKQKLESLKQTGQKQIHIFVMTDLPMANWTGSYLGSLAKDSDAFKLFVIREEDDLVQETVGSVPPLS
ncbi:hypothetical protein K7X08_003322 [Anisodus acutangulus]|uniref:Uncharacterized protein n=1 Tax=Anisodus acutangulus TaxID=402998 RepID=A0A9Q1M9Z2_9SOLA|nr:hypothetical protein K7X08_003322 [Anisodus acutangulus]